MDQLTSGGTTNLNGMDKQTEKWRVGEILLWRLFCEVFLHDQLKMTDFCGQLTEYDLPP